MTPKVGDKFKITKSNFYGDAHTEGGIVTFLRNGSGHGLGEFRAATGLELTFAYEGNKHYPCHVVLHERVPTPKKDPIEYLKSAHADGDMINPETMLRECYGITKTERGVVEWSEVKREIKVGDKVRIIGDASFTDQSKYIGEIKTVVNIDHGDEDATYDIGPFGIVESFWFPASSVELV